MYLYVPVYETVKQGNHFKRSTVSCLKKAFLIGCLKPSTSGECLDYCMRSIGSKHAYSCALNQINKLTNLPSA